MIVTRNENASVIGTRSGATLGGENHSKTRPSLPEKPLVTIQPGSFWVSLDLASLWRYRELLYFLMWRDVKVRYKQTALGAAWAVIQPLFAMLIFTLFFGKLAGISSDGIPYPLFAYAGLLPWVFFSNAITNSSNSLLGDSRLITKVYFPRMVIPIAAVGAGLVDFAVAFVILIGLMFYYGVGLTVNILWIPALVILLTLLATGVGMWLGALNVKYRDIRYALPFLVQLWMFASPIIYPTTLIPEKWRWVASLNPITGIIEAFRAALLGHRRVSWHLLAISTAITVVISVYAAYSFRRMERSFADIV